MSREAVNEIPTAGLAGGIRSDGKEVRRRQVITCGKTRGSRILNQGKLGRDRAKRNVTE